MSKRPRSKPGPKPSKGQQTFSFKKTKTNEDDDDQADWGFAMSTSQVSTTQSQSQSSQSESKKKYDAKRKRVFIDAWQDEFDWVRCENDIMFCAVCREFPTLSDPRSTLVIGVELTCRYSWGKFVGAQPMREDVTT